MTRISLYLLAVAVFTASSALAGPGGDDGRPRAVSLRPWTELVVHPRHSAPARVISLNDSPLAAELSGVVREIPVQVGQRVAAGAVLVRLDAWLYRHQLEQATAQLAETRAQQKMAQKQNRRAERLRQSGQATEELLERRETELNGLSARLRQHQAALAAARDHLQKIDLRAPFAGVVAERFAQVGAWAAPGTPLLRLVDLDHLELSVQVDGLRAAHLPQGEALTFIAGSGRYPVILRTLVPVADGVSRLREARLLFSGEKPFPGESGLLHWSDPRPHLPAHLLIRRGDRLGVFAAEAGRARFHPLPGALEGHPAQVEQPLPGQAVLIGRNALADGDPIEATPEATGE